MGEATENLMRLLPVTFRYLTQGENAPLQYGLIAEEVAKVYPNLVQYDKASKPFSLPSIPDHLPRVLLLGACACHGRVMGIVRKRK